MFTDTPDNGATTIKAQEHRSWRGRILEGRYRERVIDALAAAWYFGDGSPFGEVEAPELSTPELQ